MKPFKTFLCISFLLSGTLIGPSAVAADADGSYFQQGAMSCSKYLTEQKKESWAYSGYMAYVAGYFAAVNLKTPNTYNILGNSDLGGAMLWLKNYCERQPLSNIANALQVLIVELYPSRTIKAPN